MNKSKPTHLNLQHSESVVLECATRIYAAYITSGQVAEGEASKWMERSIREAIRMARATDDAIVSDEEIDSLGVQRVLDPQGGTGSF